MNAPASFRDVVPPAVATAIRSAATAKGLVANRPESVRAAFQRLSSGLFRPEKVPPFDSRNADSGKFDDPRAIGELYWREKSGDLSGQRRDGRYYTPVPVIDRILDLTLDGIFPDGLDGGTVCDPAVGCGFFLLRLVDAARARFSPNPAALRAWAGRALHGVDTDPGAVFVSRACLWLSLSDADGEFFPDTIVCGDSLLGGDFTGRGSPPPPAALSGPLDWKRAFPDIAARGGFDAVVGNPPYEILTNFARHPERRVLARALRESGLYQDALGGQINLFRLFVERSLSLLRDGGSLAMIVPLSLARDASAGRLRRRLLLRENAAVWLLHRESDAVFPGVTQATCVFGAKRNRGPAELVRVEAAGGEKTIPLRTLEPAEMAIPFPEDGAEELARMLAKRFPRPLSDYADLRVGEVDQTVFRDCMRDSPTGCLLARGAHLKPFRLDVEPLPSRERFLDLDLFLEKKGRQAEACRERASKVRVAQLGIRNMRTLPRLVAALVPPGVYLGNSLNVYIPKPGTGAAFLAALLNSRLLDRLFRRVSGNNNINLRETRGLPFPDRVADETRRRVEDAYHACEAAASANGDLEAARRTLDDAVYECYRLPRTWRELLRRDPEDA